MRKFIEKLVEGGFLISGSVSSFTILLIIVFLFKEAAGLFNSPEVEEGYILAVNQENPVEHLSPEQIMDVFDANITNWEDLNGENQDILVFRFSDLTNYYTEEELGEEFQYVPEKINELIHKEPGLSHSFRNNTSRKTLREKSYREPRSSLRNSLEGRNGIRPQLPLRSLG